MPRKRQHLTKSDLDAMRAQAEAEPEKTRTVADAEQPGLYVQARRGRVRFLFRYASPTTGHRRNVQIDWYGAITIEQARKAALSLRAQVAQGVDPLDARAEEQRLAITLQEAADGYLEDLRQRAETGARRGKRSGYASASRRLTKNALPTLGALRLRDVTSDHVRRLHRSMKRTPAEANRTLTALSAVFGWADRAELVPPGTNPVRHVERFAETGERRAFTTEEMQALGAALNEAQATGSVTVQDRRGKSRTHHVSRVAVLAVRLLALTGFRRAELLGHVDKKRRGPREGLRWADVDLDRGLVRMDTKTGMQTRVIGAAAVELLRAAKPRGVGAEECVCPGTVSPTQPFIGLDKARYRLWEAAGVEGVDLHSLRHSFASIGAHVQSGRFAGHVSALLGHGYQARSITERYITADPEGLRPAADAITAEVARLLGLGEEGKVLEFRAQDG